MTRPDASPRGAARRGLRLLLRAAAVVLALAGLLAGVTAAALRLQFTGAPASWARSSGHDALWLGHMWVDGRRGERDVAALAARLRDTGIKDVYVHSGPFELDGTLKPEKYPNARNFLKWWRTHLPSVRVSAWLGQEVKDGGLDLDDPANRERVLSGARAILDTGFDGVHYNFEPIGDGDAEFLELLDRTRALAPGRLLTTSVPQTEPYLGMRLLARAVIAHDKYWSRGYLREVARRVDQVAVMTYDAYWPMASLYGGHVARQTELALHTVPEKTGLLIGAPAYHDHGGPFLDAAESVAGAAEGARLALTEHGRPRHRVGLALYVDFAATETDWKEYRTAWLRPG